MWWYFSKALRYIDGIFRTFSFLRVSEKFGCRSLEIFQKKTEFSNSRNFHKKVWKNVRKLFENVHKFWKFKFWKFRKKYVKFEFLSQKTLFLGQKVWKKFGKSLEKVWKKFEKSLVKFENFGNWVFRMLGNCYFLNFLKFTKKWC